MFYTRIGLQIIFINVGSTSQLVRQTLSKTTIVGTLS